MLPPSIKRNDRTARWTIIVFSVVVFTAVALLSNFTLKINPGFDVHILAFINAVINSITAVLLLIALSAVKNGKYLLHKNLMFAALILSMIFLVCYIAHHLLAGEALFGDSNHDGTLSDAERTQSGSMRTIYLIILATHILLAAIILPFILFTTYRGLTAQYVAHKKLAKYTWPLWLYVAITGPVVYIMISPFYR